MFARFLCSAALSACLALPVLAESTTRPVIFAAGSTGTAVTGQVMGADTADFTLTAEAGQRMNVRMNADKATAIFDIYAPGAVPGQSQALFSSATSGQTADLSLPTSGVYVIRTYLQPAAAQLNETARFSLTFDIAGRRAQSGDVAGALNAAPDYWKVTGITGQLNIRAEASTTSAVAGTVPPDTTLRSLGCQATDGRNWCKVETVAGTAITGWAAGDFLTPGTAPDGYVPPAEPAPSAMPAPAAATGAAQTSIAPPAVTNSAGSIAAQPVAAPVTAATAPQPAPAAPAGTVPPSDRPAVVSTRPPVAPPSKIPLGGVRPKPTEAAAAAPVSSAKPARKPVQAGATSNRTAVGTLPCSTALGMPTRDCAYSVSHEGSKTTVQVAWPDGGQRKIRFENGTPAPVSGVLSERRGNLTVINIGNERYEIPDSVTKGN